MKRKQMKKKEIFRIIFVNCLIRKAYFISRYTSEGIQFYCFFVWFASSSSSSSSSTPMEIIIDAVDFFTLKRLAVNIDALKLRANFERILCKGYRLDLWSRIWSLVRIGFIIYSNFRSTLFKIQKLPEMSEQCRPG